MKLSPRLAITLTYICFGVCVGVNIGALPELQTRTGVTAYVFGYMAALGTVANIAMMTLGGTINRRFDHRTVLLFILPLVFVSMAYTLTVTSVFTFAFSFVIFNMMIGTLDLFMNAEGASIEHQAGKPIFASLHGATLLGMGVFALIGSYISVTYSPIYAALPALPMIAAAYYTVYKMIPHSVAHTEEVAKKSVLLPVKALVLIGAVIGLDVACELSCVQWAGQLLAKLQPSLAAYSGLGVAFYCLCNGSVRLIGDNLRRRFGDMPLMYVSFSIGLIGFMILGTSPGFAVSVFAFALAGMGLALIFPCMFSIAGQLAPQTRAAALGLVSGIGGIPRFLFPMLLGNLAAVYGLNSIYIAAAVTCVVALGFTAWAGIAIKQQIGAQVSPRPAS